MHTLRLYLCTGTPRVARIAAYTVIPLLPASDRSYTSPRAFNRSFEPPRRVQHLNLPSSTLTRYREKHRSTPSPHQTGRTTFKRVGPGHRTSSDIPHSSGHQKRRSRILRSSFASMRRSRRRICVEETHLYAPLMPRSASIGSTYTI